jgi:hypothetical protein
MVSRISRDLATISNKDLTARCLAATTLARWIAWKGLKPKDSCCWRIAVIGAEELDSFDGGKWYGIVPVLLDLEVDIELFLIGPRLKLHSARFPTLGPAVVGTRPVVNAFKTTLASCWADLPLENLDLAILFQPGFENDDQWFGGPDLRLIAESRLPVAASSYGEDEQVIDREVLTAYGFMAKDDVAENPLHMEMGHPNVRWGHTLWQVANRAPPFGFLADNDRLNDIHALSRMLTKLFDAGFINRPLEFGFAQKHNIRGERRRLVYLLADVYAEAASGRIWRKQRQGWSETELSLPREVMEARPPERKRSLDGAIWALKATAPLL